MTRATKSTEGKSLDRLDMDANNLGMGGVTAPEKDEKKYRDRMQTRREVQAKRLASRDKEKGLLIVFTGTGKGKTTAALGIALRTLGHDQNVAIVQFIKGGWEPGEKKALKSFGSALKWHSLGEGFTWETQDRVRDKELVQKSWKIALEYILSNKYKLVILDEILVALKLGYLPREELLKGIKARPPLTHIVLTGRGAPKEILDKADLVTEMKLIHHPFKEQGVKAQKGIEF